LVDVESILLAAVPSTSLLGVIIYLLKNPEKAEKWGAILARCFAGLSDASERRSVSGEIQSDINSFAKDVTGKVEAAILPYGIKIKWEKGDNVSYESFVREGQVVVRMRNHRNQARNLALATIAYVQTGFLPDTRPHFDQEVSDAMDITMARKILLDRRRSDALSIFNKELVTQQTPMAARMCKIMQDLDTMGMFNEMLLREMADLGKRLTGIAPTEDNTKEIRDFVVFCEKLTEKEPGENVSPDFKKKLLRVSIVLIAKSKTYAEQGVAPHLNWVDKCLKEEIDSIYISARGPNIKAAHELDTLLQSYQSLRRIGERSGKVLGKKGEIVDGVCIVYKRLASF
jgi:hypothetical protein